MGAWGAGPFQNDDALDWAGSLKEGGVKVIAAAIDYVHTTEGFLESSASSKAIAAAEVVAACAGHPAMGDLPESVSGWRATSPWRPPAEMIRAARAAVARIRGPRNSELAELWADADEADAKAWLASLDDLAKRLSS